MNLSPGTRLGSYEIIAPLGSGGMGEVYRARDSRLNRDVAVKVLAHRLTGNPEALARFKREAQAVAALSHPNVLSLFDYGESDGTVFAVMELLDGETLRARLTSGLLPQRKAVEIAVQIARGLAAAHERGIVHRDLKPENVFLTRDGQVKVLDFGLARLAAEGPDGGATFSPTPSLPTRPGIVMGTPGYMSPEQVRGQAADPRSDIFAFGTILYEMLAGRRAFRADTAVEMMTAALREEPAELPAGVPPAIQRIVRHCLEKDREQRFQSARDLAFQLEAILEPSASSASAVPARRRRTVPAWVTWTAAAAGLVAGVLGWLVVPRAAPPGGPLRFSISLPAGLRLTDLTLGVLVSPDGRSIAFAAARGNDSPQLWLRPLDRLEPRPLAGTEGASMPFWSPDSRFLGFFAAGKLKRVGVEGSTPPQILCDAADGRGGAWNQQGDILFAPDSAGGLYRVPAAGGEPLQVTRLGKGEDTHRLPTFLPDGRRFLYLSRSATPGHAVLETRIASLDDPKPTPLLRASSVATVVPGGDHILFIRDQTVLAQRLDLRTARLLGEPQPIGEMTMTISEIAGGPIVSGASTGLLAFASKPRGPSRLQWFDRTGVPGITIPLPADYQLTSLSPDARYATLELQTSIDQADLWLLDLASGIMTRLTHEPGVERWPAWSPDSRRVAYIAFLSDIAQIQVRDRANPERKEIVFTLPIMQVGGTSWSRDARFLFFHQRVSRSLFDLWFLRLDGARRPVSYLRTPFNEEDAILSPDGRWLAYFSDESGTAEIYVQSFPDPGHKMRLSTGASPPVAWSADSRQLIYAGRDGDPTVVDVKSAPEPRVSQPRFLFHLPPGAVGWDRAVDGRLLVQIREGEPPSANITVIANWPALLEPDRR